MSAHTIRRIAVINRAEPAVRFLRALREYNLERGLTLEAVAFYTDPDEGAPFVRLADRAVRLGPALRTRADGSAVSAYTDHDHVLDHIAAAGCDAVWPGWGFISEDAAFVGRLEEAGIAFIGPSSEAMFLLGDKIAAKRLAEDSGVPLAAWYEIVEGASEADIAEAAEGIGYPLMVKASAGGGGRGIRKVTRAEDLLGAVRSARDEVAKVFGAGGLMLERCITGARHVEVQLVAGADGHCTALGVRDCSIQRKNQKVVEETPSPVLSVQTAELLRTASARLAEKAGYRGVATAEYLYDPREDRAFFLEVNSRLQVEHTITEAVSGCDLVKAQLDIARGLPWEHTFGHDRGHAIEVRVNAEDPEQGFRPSPGMVRVFRAPSGPGIRVDSGIVEGAAIAPEFDSMIAKVIAWAPTRMQAIMRLRRALQELELVVEDGSTNKSFLVRLLQHPAFIDGSADTQWLDRAVSEGLFAAPALSFEALLAAAVLESRRLRYADIGRFFAEAQNGIPQHLPEPTGQTVDLRLRGRGYGMQVYAVGRQRYLVGPDEQLHLVELRRTGPHTAEIRLQGEAGERRHEVLFSFGSNGIAVEVDGVMHHVERASGGVIKAPSPAMVVHVSVAEGDAIAPGDRLCTLEAMKMEMAVNAQEAGVVRSVLCQPNQHVTAGQPLILMETEGAGEGGEGEAQPNVFPAPTPRPLDRLFEESRPRPEALDEAASDAEAAAIVADLTGALESLLLGYDAPPALVERLEALFHDRLSLGDLRRRELLKPLAGVIACFADAESLFDRNFLLVPEEAAAVTADLAFYEFCRRHHEGEDGAQAELRPLLTRALHHYGVHALDPTDTLREVLWRLVVGHSHDAVRHRVVSLLMRMVMRLAEAGVSFDADDTRGPDQAGDGLRQVLERTARVARGQFPFVADNARQAIYLLFERSRYVQQRADVELVLDAALNALADLDRASPEGRETIEALVAYRYPLLPLLQRRSDPSSALVAPVTEAMVRRLYLGCPGRVERLEPRDGLFVGHMVLTPHRWEREAAVVVVVAPSRRLDDALRLLRAELGEADRERPLLAELILSDLPADGAALEAQLDERVRELGFGRSDTRLRRLTATFSLDAAPRAGLKHRTWVRVQEPGLVLDERLLGTHPEAASRIELWRLDAFDLQRLEAPEQLYAFTGSAHTNEQDRGVFVFAEVHKGAHAEIDYESEELRWEIEHVYFEALRVIREAQAQRDVRSRFHWNRLSLFVVPILRVDARDVAAMARRFEAPTRGLGIQKVVIRARVPDPETDEVRMREFVIRKPGRHRLEVEERSPNNQPFRAMTPYQLNVVRCRRRGGIYPYEIARMLQGREGVGVAPHPDMREGRFVELDLDRSDPTRLIHVDRPYGMNEAGVVVGLVTNFTAKHPEGLERVWIAGDPTHAMGALAEPECRRILAAIDLAEERKLPIEWLPVSAGAKIAMDSGTENLDWTARVLRRIVQFTQAGGEIHCIVAAVNVGAQSYWNAEATMLMHTRGALIMTRDGSMVLTGKRALEYSGGVAAEDERGIGGFERIMGPNGQAQYFAADLGEAYRLLFEFYRFTYRAPGERWPRRFPTSDPADRSVLSYPYSARAGEPFSTIGEIFSDATNPERKKPYAIRQVMGAVIDGDGGHLERFSAMRHGESAVVWDAHIGGIPVCLLGIESRPMPRRGRVPMDGPETWTGGTLFPQSSKKVARGLNAASGIRPAVVLANLSGFDGSPESLRKLQLELGAEIGRAVVNFDGPLVFVVIGRYHGGAYVVFSKALNPQLRAMALEGTFASVIGGAPAAAVVFPREVRRRTQRDPRVVEATRTLEAAAPVDKPLMRERLGEVRATVTLEHQGAIAKEFEGIHTVERAVSVGSLDQVLAPARLRPAIVAELERALGEAPTPEGG